MAKVLIVDDEESILVGLKDNFELEGYDVEVDFTLTAEEAQQLRDAGYDVPDAVLEGRATLGGADSAADDDGEDEE